MGDRVIKDLDPKMTRNIRDSLKKQVKLYQDFINSDRFSEMLKFLPADSRILILTTQKKVEGSRAVVNFWKTQKKLGLKTIEFKIIRVSVEPWKMSSSSKNYNAVGYVLGTYSVTRAKRARKLDLPASYFCVKSPHQDDCNWGIGDLFLG